MRGPLLASNASSQQRATRFAEFYQAVHGRPPFAWQKRLAAEVLDPDNGWPEVIRVPTGCGKTSILDIAVFELAVQAQHDPENITAARRICFVVDRKLIVDEATIHSAALCDTLIKADDRNAILARVAQALRSLTPHPDESNQDPLRVVRLRGGVYRDDGWAADPVTPTIIISTIDQIGSRLFFRGYGVSRRSRAVHAGLLAFDNRIIVDEAHLSAVFSTTLAGRDVSPNGKPTRVAGVKPYQAWAERAVLPESRRIRFVRMSATAGIGNRMFELTKEEREDTALRPRLEAQKPAALIKEQGNKNRETLVDAMVKHASGLAVFKQDNEPDRPRVVGLVFNRVASARRAFEQFREHLGETAKDDVVLLTGRIRPFDRDRLLNQWLPRIKAGREAQPDRPLFVVATQTVEVGANIDFDALITEAAPLDSLRQRFGRLHRIPEQPAKRPSATAAVFIQSNHATNSSTDPLYGQATAETRKWLNRNGVAQPPASSKKGKPQKTPPSPNESTHPQVDFASARIDALLHDDKTKPANLSDLLAPQPVAPILFPAHLDAWAQTNPQPDPDPDVAPFLHGPGSDSADVQVVWRKDLTTANRKDWPEIVALMPPRTRESLAVPLHVVRKWLCNLLLLDAADVEGAAGSDAHTQGRARPALRWRGADRSRPVRPEQLRPGDTIVVPASYGGADEFGWHGRSNASAETPVTDVADQSLAELIASYPDDAFRRPPLRVRLHPSLLGSDPAQADACLKVRNVLSQAAWSVANDGDPLDDVRRALQEWPALAAAGEELRVACTALLENLQRASIEPYPDGKGVVVSAHVSLTAPRQIPEHDLEIEEPDDDRASILDGGQPVTLDEHTDAVKRMANDFALACALPDDLRGALESAAFWHDQGKRDRRFQAWLHGSELAAFAALAEEPPRVLAKSARSHKAHGLSSSRFGYPRCHRHEFVSVRLFERAAEIARADGSPIPDADLVKYLIGTHHGRGRALAPVSRDNHPVQIRMDHQGRQIEVSSDHALHTLDSGWSDLFWSLIRKHGWWGLAYLEALLITADRLVSSEQRRRAAGTIAEPTPDRAATQSPAHQAPAASSVVRTTR